MRVAHAIRPAASGIYLLNPYSRLTMVMALSSLIDVAFRAS